ncbi:superoxide dismutase [Oceanococcus atlanticus]|uniref:Superoxide dismutase n=1 Tax=Oceanococcus atlanticus TaxID=1317117 RepID=A0A1Y1SFP7_9GAMM|nr:Fe-Mn family superoxide dismutase [Oceanococcus atlanticus]ORE88473.1 superoxide dismutase [Oceanococcus atlanticus]
MAFTLPELPYARDALEPHMSKETLDFHYGKHHQTYVDKANGLVAGTPDENKSLEELIKSSSGGLFNNVAQIWNHTFFWNCLTPGGSTPNETVTSAIASAFGSMDAFKEQFTNSAINNFGSGWTWLVKNADGGLEIVNTSNAGNPMTDGKTPLMTVDVWEHAYYIDHRNARPKFLESFWALANWDFVAQNLG